MYYNVERSRAPNPREELSHSSRAFGRDSEVTEDDTIQSAPAHDASAAGNHLATAPQTRLDDEMIDDGHFLGTIRPVDGVAWCPDPLLIHISNIKESEVAAQRVLRTMHGPSSLILELS